MGQAVQARRLQKDERSENLRISVVSGVHRRLWYIVVDTHSIVSVLDVCQIRRLLGHILLPFWLGGHICRYAGQEACTYTVLVLGVYSETGHHNNKTLAIL